jgi:hypothetical protein
MRRPAKSNDLSVMTRICPRALVAFVVTELLLTSISPAAQFLNISTRGSVGIDNHALIGGLILRGAAAKRVLLRGMGPSLNEAGLPDVLSDPVLELRDQNGTLLLTNNDWKDSQRAEIEATGLAPRDDREAALLTDLLSPGLYTAILRGAGNGTGLGLIEVYDLSPNTGSLLANISTRGFTETGDRAMIGGFIVGAGSDTARVLVRGIGPSLAAVGINDSLPDPTLELWSSNGALLMANNNWKTTQRSLIEQTGIPPTHDLESGMVTDVSAGAYTAILRDNANAAGTALVELYHLNASPAPVAMFSFENGLESWTPKATDIDNPPIQWSIEPSQERATDGVRSLKFALANYNDAGKIWVERAFTVRPNRQFHVTIQFSFGTADWGDANHFTIIAGVRTQPAITRSDLTYQGLTANGESSNTGYKWLEKNYDFNLLSAADGTLYLDIGIWGTWETYRAYYLDNLRVTITENNVPAAP